MFRHVSYHSRNCGKIQIVRYTIESSVLILEHTIFSVFRLKRYGVRVIRYTQISDLRAKQKFKYFFNNTNSTFKKNRNKPCNTKIVHLQYMYFFFYVIILNGWIKTYPAAR